MFLDFLSALAGLGGFLLTWSTFRWFFSGHTLWRTSPFTLTIRRLGISCAVAIAAVIGVDGIMKNDLSRSASILDRLDQALGPGSQMSHLNGEPAYTLAQSPLTDGEANRNDGKSPRNRTDPINAGATEAPSGPGGCHEPKGPHDARLAGDELPAGMPLSYERIVRVIEEEKRYSGDDRIIRFRLDIPPKRLRSDEERTAWLHALSMAHSDERLAIALFVKERREKWRGEIRTAE